jgi:hypothetical protein
MTVATIPSIREDRASGSTLSARSAPMRSSAVPGHESRVPSPRSVPTTISGVPTEVFVESILARLGHLLGPLRDHMGFIRTLATDMALTDEERGARLRRLFADEPEPKD